jgi:16S rRNA (guanine527-N7)-methyltransferase
MGEVRKILHEALGRLASLGPWQPPEAAAERLEAYVLRLHQYNGVHRIVGPRSAPEIARGLVVDCLELAPRASGPVADVGSGAGLPGLIIKLCRPELAVTLIEPRNKPAAFLALIRAELGLAGLTIVDRRAEELTPADLEGHGPAVLLAAKGLGPLEKLIATAGHLLAAPGTALVLASSDVCAVPGARTEPSGLVRGRYLHSLAGAGRAR